jgi:23S rRNA (uracil1939-C5)-methyltransferase
MEVTIERLGHLGDGIAPGPVFVPRTLPGEVVEGDVSDGRIDAPRIVTPSQHRVRPPCPHYRTCGGCALQHASDGFVADWKVGVVQSALRAQGLPDTVEGIATSPPRSRRRAVLSGRRTKSGALVGFHAPKSDQLTAIPSCILLDSRLMAAMPAFEALTIAGASRKAEIRLLVTAADGGVDVAVTGGKPLDAGLETELARIAGEHGLSRLTWNDEQVALIAPPIQRFAAVAVVPPPGAFLQATQAGEDALRASVEAAVGDARRILDLFAGCGTFSLPLAARAEVHAVEGDEAMIAALDKGWRMAKGLKPVTTEMRDLYRQPLLPDELDRFDAVVIDPPRAGAEAQIAEIARSGVRLVAAVSCNPVTFARDAKALNEAGFTLDRLRVVDQFRWSTHVELVARFVR